MKSNFLLNTVRGVWMLFRLSKFSAYFSAYWYENAFS